MKTKISTLLLLGVLFFGYACSKDSEITIPAVTPVSSLVYSPNMLSTPVGTAAQSAMPTLAGAKPYTFSLTTVPDHGGKISITSDGVIKAASDLAKGDYVVTVSVANSVGTVPFANAYTVSATLSETATVTFTNDVAPLMTLKCANCHTSGGSQPILTDYATAKSKIDKMIDRVQRDSGTGGFMPKGGAALSTTEIQMLKDWLAQGTVE